MCEYDSIGQLVDFRIWHAIRDRIGSGVWHAITQQADIPVRKNIRVSVTIINAETHIAAHLIPKINDLNKYD